MKLSTDFAFEGFRIIRQRPTVVLFWGIVMLVSNVAAIFVLQACSGDAMQQMGSVTSTTPPEVILAILGKLLPGYAAALPIMIVSSAVLWCAVFRIVNHDGPIRFGGLRFGIDELRQCVVFLLFYLILFGVYLAVIFVGGVVAGLFGTLLMMISPVLAGVADVLIIVAAVVGFMWVFARLSLALPQSFDQRRINMFGGWTLSQGNSRELLVGFIIAFVMALLVFALCLAIFVVGLIMASHGDLDAMSKLMRLSSSGANFFTHPSLIAYLCFLNLIVNPLVLGITAGTPAAAYKALIGKTLRADQVF